MSNNTTNSTEKIQPDAKDLRDGTLLLFFKHKYLQESTQENFSNFMSCLLDSFVLLPAMNKDNTAFPLIITSDEGLNALPVFCNMEQVGEHFSDEGIDFYKMTLLECLDFLEKVEECSTVVLDPYTEGFIIDEELASQIKRLPNKE